MPVILPVRALANAAKPLSALLSQSSDDFYSQLQTIMNTLPAEVEARPAEPAGATAWSAQRDANR